MHRFTFVVIAVLGLIGCEMRSMDYQPSYQPMQPYQPITPVNSPAAPHPQGDPVGQPPQPQPKPTAYEFKKGVCTANCRKAIEAASEVDSSRRREGMLKELAGQQDMASHEQMHLADIALAAFVSKKDSADVIIVIARNPTLTKDANWHLKVLADKLYREDEKELLKALQQNPGK